jgi:uncharacterized protein YacL
MKLVVLLRIIGGLVLAYIVAAMAVAIPFGPFGDVPVYVIPIIALLGFVAGFVLTQSLIIWPVRRAYELARAIPIRDLLAAIIGLFVGLVLAALLSIPLSMLPIVGQILPVVASIAFGYLGAVVMVARRDDVAVFFRGLAGIWRGNHSSETVRTPGRAIVDTSAIIDGRIADIHDTGFMPGPLVVPQCVLAELQHIADSPEALKRNRGRRGLEILNRLRQDGVVEVDYETESNNGGDDVDAILVRLARRTKCPIITTDYNLNRVASIQGVTILNVNELANAIKSVVLPGEELNVRVVQEGRSPGQGIAYMEDGTMIVVEDGRPYVRESVEVVVTRVLQTNAGRLVFAQRKAA